MVFCTSTITPADGSTAESLLHGQHALEEAAALSAIFLRNLDTHQAEFKELAQDVLAENSRFVHLTHMGRNLLAGKPADGGLKQLLLFTQESERSGRAFRNRTGEPRQSSSGP